ncbi:MAG: HAD family phosphatase [Acidobacteriota bacterium]
MHAIHAVIFDFGNVLCFPPAPEKIIHAAATCKLPVTEFVEAFWKDRLEYDAGRLDPLEYWSRVAGPQVAAANLPDLIRQEIHFWNDFDPRPFDWIDQLRDAGIRTAILSNLPRVLSEELRAIDFRGQPFLQHFDYVTFSHELLSVKPEAAIYRHSLEGLGITGPQALFLDDKQPNVDGALAMGIQAELFTTWEDFLAQGMPAKYALPDATR